MRGGALRHMVQIQRRSTTQDSFGGQSTDWVTFATDYADVTPLSGHELLAAQAVHAAITHDVTMRFRTIGAENRIVYNGRPFNILAVLNEDERNRMLTLKCEEGMAGG